MVPSGLLAHWDASGTARLGSRSFASLAGRTRSDGRRRRVSARSRHGRRRPWPALDRRTRRCRDRRARGRRSVEPGRWSAGELAPARRRAGRTGTSCRDHVIGVAERNWALVFAIARPSGGRLRWRSSTCGSLGSLLGGAAKALTLGLAADAISLGVLDARRVALGLDAETDAEVQRLFVAEPELSCQLVNTDLPRQLPTQSSPRPLPRVPRARTILPQPGHSSQRRPLQRARA